MYLVIHFTVHQKQSQHYKVIMLFITKLYPTFPPPHLIMKYVIPDCSSQAPVPRHLLSLPKKAIILQLKTKSGCVRLYSLNPHEVAYAGYLKQEVFIRKACLAASRPDPASFSLLLCSGGSHHSSSPLTFSGFQLLKLETTADSLLN